MASFRGTTGPDAFTGTSGDDYYIINDIGDTITELPSQGNDWAYSFLANYTLAANVENLVMRDTALNGTGNELNNLIFGNDQNNLLDGAAGNDQIYGSLGNDTLLGGAGDDYLDGGAGNDRMVGGIGNDVFAVDSASDGVFENAGEGTDKVISAVNYVLANVNVENLSLIDGSAATTAVGNSVANVIAGNDKDNIIYGLAGDDTLYGRDGNDSLFGNEGADSLFGGLGNDFMTGGAGIDTMDGGDGDDSYNVDVAGDVVNDTGNGLDTVYLTTTVNGSSFDLTNSATVENLILKTGAATGVSATGNALNNTIIGSSADNVISGAGGNDYLTGGGGNDRFLLSSAATNGTDIISDFTTGDQLVVNASDYSAGTTIYDSGVFPPPGSPAGFVIFGPNLVYVNGNTTTFLASTSGHNLVASDIDIVF